MSARLTDSDEEAPPPRTMPSHGPALPAGAYYMNEAAFDLPAAGFCDLSVTHLAAPSPAGGVMVLIERRRVPPGKSLREAVASREVNLKTRTFGYALVSQREIEVATHPALDTSARWRTAGGLTIYTRTTHLRLDATWIVVTGEAHWAERGLCDGYVDHILATLRLRG
jgi:hypothetical protein